MDRDSCAMLFCPPLPPVRLGERETLTIGRHPSCGFSLQRGEVSRRHAEVRFDGRTYALRDLGSTNGSYVNGERVEREQRLSPGDRIEIGSSVITFCQIDGSVGGPEPTEAQTVVFERLESKDAFHGDLGEIPPFAVFQVLEMGGKTGLLEVSSHGGTTRIWFRRGAPHHAETEKERGFEAALIIAGLTKGRFRFEAQRVRVERTIEATVTELLLEACRLQDEAAD